MCLIVCLSLSLFLCLTNSAISVLLLCLSVHHVCLSVFLSICLFLSLYLFVWEFVSFIKVLVYLISVYFSKREYTFFCLCLSIAVLLTSVYLSKREFTLSVYFCPSYICLSLSFWSMSFSACFSEFVKDILSLCHLSASLSLSKSIYQSTYLSLSLLPTSLSLNLSIYLLTYLSIKISIYLYIYLFLYLCLY